MTQWLAAVAILIGVYALVTVAPKAVLVVVIIACVVAMIRLLLSVLFEW